MEGWRLLGYGDSVQREYREAVGGFVSHVRHVLGERLVALAVYGSVARAVARPESDVDVLIVADELPRGPRARRQLVGAAVDEAEAILHRSRPDGWLSVVLKTREEVEQGGPLFYDMTLPDHVEILHDPGRWFASFLGRLRGKMAALGAVRRRDVSGHPYWDLKPDWKPGDVIDL
jgi:hypothetical protein